ncbi:hypothetical protein [Vibrio phage vB_VmeM-Yong XC32]|nr:hypothetical protein [Vibrio phage vB_VmeM-Yong XC31]QAX96317.1 hypothetical protein [Vibrio phage vB_VmeM-Yong XC32]QAX96635.1 hypothetical protein [Vibrio phage vB_VmeM-Yong MS31]QAX96953.1 hypothetical protein [Vibrio phage vB_VmeM-Yong MS32]
MEDSILDQLEREQVTALINDMGPRLQRMVSHAMIHTITMKLYYNIPNGVWILDKVSNIDTCFATDETLATLDLGEKISRSQKLAGFVKTNVYDVLLELSPAGSRATVKTTRGNTYQLPI